MPKFYWLVVVLLLNIQANPLVIYHFLGDIKRGRLTEEKIATYIEQYGSTDILNRPGVLKNAVQSRPEMMDLLLAYAQKVNIQFSLECIQEAFLHGRNEKLEQYFLNLYGSHILSQFPSDIRQLHMYCKNFVYACRSMPTILKGVIEQAAMSGKAEILDLLLQHLCNLNLLDQDYIPQLLQKLDRSNHLLDEVVEVLMEVQEWLSRCNKQDNDRNWGDAVSMIPQIPHAQSFIETYILRTLRKFYPDIVAQQEDRIVVKTISLLQAQLASLACTEDQVVQALNEAMLADTQYTEDRPSELTQEVPERDSVPSHDNNIYASYGDDYVVLKAFITTLLACYPRVDKNSYPTFIQIILQRTPSSSQRKYNNEDIKRVTQEVVAELLP